VFVYSSDVALLYNDKAVLENHHVSSAFRLLKEDEYNILGGLKADEFRLAHCDTFRMEGRFGSIDCGTAITNATDVIKVAREQSNQCNVAQMLLITRWL